MCVCVVYKYISNNTLYYDMIISIRKYITRCYSLDGDEFMLVSKTGCAIVSLRYYADECDAVTNTSDVSMP